MMIITVITIIRIILILIIKVNNLIIYRAKNESYD